MGVKVFVLGLPGCGKSTAIRHIKSFTHKTGYKVKNYNDYIILREWFEKAPDGPEFSRADNDGFDVHDFTVFDTSLQELERRVLQEMASDEEITIIEFSRNDYVHALKQFSHSFLLNSYFLFIEAEKFVCKKRTRKRAIHRTSSDDHFVSDYIFDTYYFKSSHDCVSSVYSYISELYREDGNEQQDISIPRVTVIDNSKRNPKENFYSAIEQFIWSVVGRLDLVPRYKKEKHSIKQRSLTTQHKKNKHFVRGNTFSLVVGSTE